MLPACKKEILKILTLDRIQSGTGSPVILGQATITAIADAETAG